jgi:hypothetical protein
MPALRVNSGTGKEITSGGQGKKSMQRGAVLKHD